MVEDKSIVIVQNRDIQNMIYSIRNKQVMLDSDLAMLYQVETKYLNRQRNRNEARFPEDFCFQLTKEGAKMSPQKKKMVQVVEDICRTFLLNKG